MKKTLAATFVGTTLMAANSSAATLYEQDGLKLQLKGDLQIQLYQAPGDDEDLGVDYDDLELKFGASYALENNMSVFGELDIDWKNQADGSDDNVVDDAYVGIDFGVASVAIGRMVWGSDDMFAEKAIEMDGGIAFPETGGNDSIQLRMALGQVDAVLTTDLEEDGDESATDLMLSTDINGATVAFAFQTYEATPNADSIDTVGLLANFDVAAANIGIDYSTNDLADVLNLAISAPVANKTEAAFGITQVAPDVGDNVMHWYANVSHSLHKNVTTFAEIGDNDIDNSDMGILAGARITF